MVEEAGGGSRASTARPLGLRADEIVAANPALHALMLEVFRRRARRPRRYPDAVRDLCPGRSRRSGETGIRAGLKILCRESGVWVRPPPPAPSEAAVPGRRYSSRRAASGSSRVARRAGSQAAASRRRPVSTIVIAANTHGVGSRSPRYSSVRSVRVSAARAQPGPSAIPGGHDARSPDAGGAPGSRASRRRCHPDADLARPLLRRVRHHAVDARRGQQQREAREGAEDARVQPRAAASDAATLAVHRLHARGGNVGVHLADPVPDRRHQGAGIAAGAHRRGTSWWRPPSPARTACRPAGGRRAFKRAVADVRGDAHDGEAASARSRAARLPAGTRWSGGFTEITLPIGSWSFQCCRAIVVVHDRHLRRRLGVAPR